MRFPLAIDEASKDVNADKSILVIGGAGGVGSATIQVAKNLLKFGTVIATASRPETIEYESLLFLYPACAHRQVVEEDGS